MTQNQAQYVHCMLIPMHQHFLLLPNSSIAEVIPKTGIQADAGAPDYLLGTISWRDQQLPVINLEQLLGAKPADELESKKLCILNGINAEANIGYYAIPCSGSPQLITLNQAALRLTHDEALSPYLYCQIKIGNKVALIPNLDKLETTLQTQKQ